jgi:hypothetical protein
MTHISKHTREESDVGSDSPLAHEFRRGCTSRRLVVAYGQVTSGFQSANIPAGLAFQIQACMR